MSGLDSQDEQILLIVKMEHVKDKGLICDWAIDRWGAPCPLLLDLIGPGQEAPQCLSGPDESRLNCNHLKKNLLLNLQTGKEIGLVNP